MSKKFKIALIVFLLADALLLTAAIFAIYKPSFGELTFALFEPKGQIAKQQLNLIITALLIMLCIVLPVFIFTVYTILKYRNKNNPSSYSPNLTGNYQQLLLWVGPVFIIFIIGILILKTTHELDPRKTIASENKPLNIQVIALRWKWLFIYPDYHIASVNYLQFPKDTPLNFHLTADAPMSAFWIPELGSQIYAMNGMSTELNLIANQYGEFNGMSTEINGEGYAGMKFIAKSTTQQEFEDWINNLKKSAPTLNFQEFERLSAPSENNPKSLYGKTEHGLYDSIIKKYSVPQSN